jgi:hypothetical protein
MVLSHPVERHRSKHPARRRMVALRMGVHGHVHHEQAGTAPCPVIPAKSCGLTALDLGRQCRSAGFNVSRAFGRIRRA